MNRNLCSPFILTGFLFTLSPFAHAGLDENVLAVGRNLVPATLSGISTRIPPARNQEEQRTREDVIKNALEYFERLLNLIEADPLTAQLEAEAAHQLEIYNNRETEGAPEPNFTRLNDIRADFQDKYETPYRNARFVFGLKYPESVMTVIGNSGDKVPFVIFTYGSAAFDLLEYDRLAHRAQGHITGHRIRGYEPYLVVARRALAELRRAEAAATCHEVLTAGALKITR